ncbi:MFS transporter [Reichenbachiella agarivorans]|uniref:MFS transporter n=1 Tax=Reichenbachiella agarivorans TaxID=2979464 RepID=A0ABY6CQP0_9BACT|nr:MFS transporter [Reichenbachiella agarivorans]UXP31678.1 MFS transporter [Reichenbachiella agarivorans]
MNQQHHEGAFSKYQIFVIAILSILQFTIVLDFMVISPLSAILLEELSITTSQFGLVVSAYAFSAGASGLLASGFADKFDRKQLLLFFYTGFILGTLFCGLAQGYLFLLIARIVTGLFGGVMSSISYAIITDLFALQKRGRVMGFVQMAFAASQILGIPVGLYIANQWNWHAPFLLIVGISLVVGVLIVLYLKPISEHLGLQTKQNPFRHMSNIFKNPRYMKGFAATTLLATGGFMLMPFGAAFSVNNLGISLEELPLVYMITGVFSIFMGPIAGKLSDRIGKYKVFWVGSLIATIVILIYCHLGITSFAVVILLNVIMFMGITARMVSSQALLTAIPEAKDRGAFMSINSSVMQVSGGIASWVAGLIVVQAADGKLENYGALGFVVTGTIFATIALMYMVNKMVFHDSQVVLDSKQEREPDLVEV